MYVTSAAGENIGSALVPPLQRHTTIRRNSTWNSRSLWLLVIGSESVDRVWLIGFTLAFTDSLPCLGSVCLGSHLIPILLSYVNVSFPLSVYLYIR